MRPAFLTRPELWTRASRTGQSAVDSACAVERSRKSGRAWHDWAVLVVLLAFVLLFLMGAA